MRGLGGPDDRTASESRPAPAKYLAVADAQARRPRVMRSTHASALVLAAVVVAVLGFSVWIPGLDDPASQSLGDFARHLRQTIRP